jgi:hypothetical protein
VINNENHQGTYCYKKTSNYLQEIINKKSSCPNENEYQSALKPIFEKELEACKIWYQEYLKEEAQRDEIKAQLKEKERLQKEAALTIKIIEMEKVCKDVPRVNQNIIEKISIAGRIDPQSVRLNRVQVTNQGDCLATFYTSIGIAKTFVGFNTNGVIVSTEKIEFPR